MRDIRQRMVFHVHPSNGTFNDTRVHGISKVESNT
jgi:hypothetical protein